MESRPTLQRADDYGESADAYIPIGKSALGSADSELESAASIADSNADPLKIGVWVRAFTLLDHEITTMDTISWLFIKIRCIFKRSLPLEHMHL